MNLLGKNAKELVVIHNEHAGDAGAEPIKKWGGKVEDLRKRTSKVVAKALEVRAAKAKPTLKKRGFGVGAYVNELLQAGTVDTNVVLDLVAEKFPEAKTTANCVRWYASKAGIRLQTARAARM